MDLSAFSENIIAVPYERNGETVELSVNIDAFTPDFFREAGRRFTAKEKELGATDKPKPKGKAKPKNDALQFFELEAVALEVRREVYADLLSSGVLKAWTVTQDGVPIAPTKDVLVTLPPRLVEELWHICLNAAKTVKKRGDEETEEILESTPSGSREHLALAPTG